MLDGSDPPDWPEPTSDPKEEGRRGNFGRPLCGKEEERGKVERRFRVVENYVGWRMSMSPPGGVSELFVCLPSALATGWPLAVLGIWNARKAKGEGWLAGHRDGQEWRTEG